MRRARGAGLSDTTIRSSGRVGSATWGSPSPSRRSRKSRPACVICHPCGSRVASFSLKILIGPTRIASARILAKNSRLDSIARSAFNAAWLARPSG